MSKIYAGLTDMDKHAIDLLGLNAVWLIFYNNLPELGILMTTIWTLIRIYETDTVQKLLGKYKKEEKE